jgi:hypothetical protein
VPPLIPRSRRVRTGLLIAAAVVVVAVVAIVLANTADSGSKKTGRKPGTSSGATPLAGLKLQLGTIHVQSAGPKAPLPSQLRRLVVASAQHYIDSAILAPLEGGKLGFDYAKDFDGLVKPAATSEDRLALTEAGTGLVSGPLRATASHVRLDGLGDPTGKMVLVAASFSMKIEGSTPTGPLTIARATELTFANEFGKWVVTAYNVGVTRTINHSTTVTTARAGEPKVSQ